MLVVLQFCSAPLSVASFHGGAHHRWTLVTNRAVATSVAQAPWLSSRTSLGDGCHMDFFYHYFVNRSRLMYDLHWRQSQVMRQTSLKLPSQRGLASVQYATKKVLLPQRTALGNSLWTPWPIFAERGRKVNTAPALTGCRNSSGLHGRSRLAAALCRDSDTSNDGEKCRGRSGTNDDGSSRRLPSRGRRHLC